MALATGRSAKVGLPFAVLLAGVLAVLTAVLASALTGATAANLLVDPGAAVRWGLPAVRVISDAAAALTLGLLLLTAVALPTSGRSLAHRPALSWTSSAATIWAVASLGVLTLTYAEVAGRPLSDPRIGAELVAFARDVDVGRGLAFTAAVAAVVGLAAAAATTLRAAGLLTLLALAALVPPALAGHSSGSADHELAVTALGLHLLGVTVWVGGLAALALLRPGISDAQLVVTVRRYSALALWCFVAVAGSGAVSAWVRLDGVDGLASRYGVVVLLKILLLVALGAAGYAHRRTTLQRLDAARPGSFTRLAVIELMLMAAALGLGAALSRTAPPASLAAQPPADAAQALSGYPLPPPLEASRWLTEWQPDLLWIILSALAAGLYLAGVRRLRARGDSWPIMRTVVWMVGVAALIYTTCGPPSAYGRVLFSAHMVGHMAISMMVPLLLVLGAPVTLALRTLPSRRDGSRGPREWLIAVVESPVLRVLSFAPVTAVIFAGGLVAFYYSDLFRLALTTHPGHELMHVHFLLSGFLFAWLLIGIDPGPARPSHPLRLVVLFATMTFHAFFGVALYAGTTVLQEDYFGRLGRDWGPSLLDDQRLGGGLAWAIGEVPMIVLVIVMAVQWSRADSREARRRDRAADRDDDAELTAYNAMLARLADRDRDRASDRAHHGDRDRAGR